MKRPMPRPLLDRFMEGGFPKTLGQYAEIILRDVEKLLNTRATPSFEGDETSPAYGLPDLTVCGRTDGELFRLALKVKNCLDCYEPRLSNISVEPLPPGPQDIDRLTVKVTAVLTGFEKQLPLSFQLPLPFNVG